MKELITYIASQLVDSPEQVTVEEADNGQVREYRLRVAKDDLGKVIGKQGRTAKALRVLLSAVSRDAAQRVSLQIVE